MNERIKELAKQSLPEFYLTNCPSALEKFAELIAKECARLAMTQHMSTGFADYDEMDPYDRGRDDAASCISGMIRGHFGVK